MQQETEGEKLLREVKVARARINMSLDSTQNTINRIDQHLANQPGEQAQAAGNTRGMYLDYAPVEEEKSSQQSGKLSPEEIAKILASVQATTASLDNTIESTGYIQTVVNRHTP